MEQRQYALKSAPLRRVQFTGRRPHQAARWRELLVESRRRSATGCSSIATDGREVPEAELSDTISFSKPEDRLLAGQVDDLHTFDLRAEALRRRSRMQQVRRCADSSAGAWI